MKNLLEKGTRCLIIQTEFSSYSFWNYVDVCKLAGAKYPAAPLGLLTVASLLPQHWILKLVDANVEPLRDEYFEWADIVCIGGMLPQQQSMLSTIDKIHQYGRPVVAGGPDPTSQPDLYQAADYLVQGEGEVTIPMWLEDLGKGCGSGEYKSDKMADMSQAVVPRFDLIRFRDYLHIGIQYSRGCPFNCEFCDIIELYGREPRIKKPKQITKELQALFDLGYRGHVDFVDDNFIGNKRNVKKVLPLIREWSAAHQYPFFFSTESSVNLADDENLMQMMQDIDFRFVFVGIETPEGKSLELTNKKINLNRSIVNAVHKISSHGMIVNAGFIIGFDTETKATAGEMIKCIQATGICMAMVGKLYALPNTQLTKRLEREKRLFENGSTLKETELDQMSSGLNFITSRDRLEILKDYYQIVQYIYDPKHYYQRIIHTSLHLKPVYKFRPGFVKLLKNLKVFLKVCVKAGMDKKTRRFYWRTLVTVVLKNPRAFEASVNLSAMFIHFYKQSRFIMNLTADEIKNMENHTEKKYTLNAFKEDMIFHPGSLL